MQKICKFVQKYANICNIYKKYAKICKIWRFSNIAPLCPPGGPSKPTVHYIKIHYMVLVWASTKVSYPKGHPKNMPLLDERFIIPCPKKGQFTYHASKQRGEVGWGAPCIEMRGMKDNFIFFNITFFLFLFILTIIIENMDNTLISDIILPYICGK